MAGYLLDTHIALWWRATPQKLSKAQTRVMQELERRGERARISVIALLELAMLVERGRLRISVPLESWLRELEEHPLIEVLPLDATIISESVQLGYGFHADPADRLIVATARCHGLKLLTADDRIREWGRVPVV